jgi:hypothetical protein
MNDPACGCASALAAARVNYVQNPGFAEWTVVSVKTRCGDDRGPWNPGVPRAAAMPPAAQLPDRNHRPALSRNRMAQANSSPSIVYGDG